MDVIIYTDSKYVIDGITKWIFGWLKNNWTTASKKPVANCLLWKELFALSKNQRIEWVWVKGHSGLLGNEKADSLAVKGRKEAFNEITR